MLREIGGESEEGVKMMMGGLVTFADDALHDIQGLGMIANGRRLHDRGTVIAKGGGLKNRRRSGKCWEVMGSEGWVELISVVDEGGIDNGKGGI
jgi:hypothetical protein